jgi:hypothetical protein
VRFLVLVLAAGLGLSACGEAPRPAAEPRVKLKLELPGDGVVVRAEAVQVRGTVTPAGATVQIEGKAAQVQAGRFTAEIALAPGGNVIDVSASSPGRRPATDALRVKRDMSVEIPSLRGNSYTDAVDALKALNLKATEDRGGTWLDRVLGTQFRVCTTEPAPGELVQPNTTVTVTTGPAC